jgi:hypothetical protein
MAVDALGTRVPFLAFEFPKISSDRFQNFGLKTLLLLGSQLRCDCRDHAAFQSAELRCSLLCRPIAFRIGRNE